MKNWISLKFVFFLAILTLFVNVASAEGIRNVAEYNLENQLSVKGFDPVAYFPEGGGKAVKGNSGISLVYKDVLYYFSSEENKSTFLASPSKYEPSYGNWCAWAMSQNAKADIQPDQFTIHGNRLHLFLSRRAKANFDRDVAKYETKADENWEAFSGELPRL